MDRLPESDPTYGGLEKWLDESEKEVLQTRLPRFDRTTAWALSLRHDPNVSDIRLVPLAPAESLVDHVRRSVLKAGRTTHSHLPPDDLWKRIEGVGVVRRAAKSRRSRGRPDAAYSRVCEEGAPEDQRRIGGSANDARV
jgi:hypothetical protein